MRRICVAIGPWQIIMLAAALEQRDHDLSARSRPVGDSEDYLILYDSNPVSDAFRQAMMEVAACVRPWAKVIWAGDLLESQRVFGHSNWQEYRAEVRARVAVTEADELWVGKLTTCPEHIISDFFPGAPVYVYEDGFGSYVPHRPHVDQLTGECRPWRERAVKAAKRFVEDWIPSRRHLHVSPRYIRRCKGVYGFIAHEVPVPEPLDNLPLSLISKDVLFNVLARCHTLPDVVQAGDSDDLPKSCALMLPQTFYKWRIITREQEVDIYKRVISGLLDQGHIVLWKEHPRADMPFYPEMEAAFGKGQVRAVSLPFTLPIEFVAPHLNINAWVAAGSSSLYYLSRLYGLPAYTFADEVIPYLTGNARRLAEITATLVPPVSQIATPMARGAR